MITDLVAQLKKLVFFLETFDDAWKSNSLKQIFPPQAREKLEELGEDIKGTSKRQEIINTFADWNTMGVWNVSDLLTFLLTSRMTMYLADSIEKADKEGIQEGVRYLMYFINYLLLTNIHPPSETQKDYIPFYDSSAPYPTTYADAQDEMRCKLAEFFAGELYSRPEYVEEISQIAGEEVDSIEKLKKLLEYRFLPRVTPPFLIKNVGLAKELFLFYKLISENIGYVIPTLLYQRIFKGLSGILAEEQKRPILIRVPDFIVIRGGHVMGIELGRERGYFGTQKAALVTTFSGASGLPTTQVNISIGNRVINQTHDFGFKCNRCYRSFALCKAFIEGEIGIRDSFYSLPDGDITCENICGVASAEGCRDSVIRGGIKNYRTGQRNLKIVHFKCLLNDEINETGMLVPFFPQIEGIEALREGLL